MIKLLANETIPELARYFKTPFEVMTYSRLSKSLLQDKQVLLCRASDQLPIEWLEQSPLQVIATASSGSDHIPTMPHYKIIDAKGANAQAVCDYVVSTLAFLVTNTQLPGNKLAIIGLGHVGSLVAKITEFLGFELFCCDPFLARNNPELNWYVIEQLSQCDIFTLHVPYTTTGPEPTHHLVNRDFLNQLKTGSVIINTSRGDIVDEQALLQFDKLIYCSDVYANEPDINADIIDFAYLCTPHIAGHSIEAKLRATALISEKLHHHFAIDFKKDEMAKTSVQSLSPTNWQQMAINHYSPLDETKLLKQSTKAKLAQEFTSLRKAHKMRHDSNFVWQP